MYNIIEVHQEYEENKLSLMAVLWESADGGWVRASYSTNKPIGGYYYLGVNVDPSKMLLQKVAGGGMNLPDNLKKKYFPGKKMWEN